MSAEHKIFLLCSFRILLYLYKNFSLEVAFLVMVDTIDSPDNVQSRFKPKYLTLFTFVMGVVLKKDLKVVINLVFPFSRE